MTIMPVLSEVEGTPIEGITAPAYRADPNTAPPTETFTPSDEFPLIPSRRGDGWSAANQRTFLERIAEGHGVEIAANAVGLSVTSAYSFRRSAKGAAFALGWRAATLVAREAVAETLMVRALEGQVETVTRADGTTFTRHRYDNRLAMGLLSRLDRQVENTPDADVKAARLVAQEFDAFLASLVADDGPARAGLFLARAAAAVAELTPGSSPGRPAGPKAPSDVTGFAPVTAPAIGTLLAPIYALAAADRLVRTGVATADEVDVSDLDLAQRASWTAEQWARAEAAGLLTLAAPAPGEEIAPAPQHSQHSAVPPSPCDALAATLDGADDIWFDHDRNAYYTSFPPPPDFIGYESQDYGHADYHRELADEEQALVDRVTECLDEEDRTTGLANRETWFAALADALAETERALAEADAAAEPAASTEPRPVTAPLPVTPAKAGVSRRKSQPTAPDEPTRSPSRPREGLGVDSA